MAYIVFGVFGAIIFAVSGIYVGINMIVAIVLGILCGAAIASTVLSLFARLAVFTMMAWAVGVALYVLPPAVMPSSFSELLGRRTPIIKIATLDRQIVMPGRGNCKSGSDKFDNDRVFTINKSKNADDNIKLLQATEIVCDKNLLNKNECQAIRLKVLGLIK